MKKILYLVLLGFGAQSTIAFSQTWEEKNSGTDYILFDISIPAGQNNIAYAAGSQFTTENAEGIIIKSTDGGETWSKIYPSDGETGLNIQKIQFVSETKGFAAGYNGTFLKTEDGGVSWNLISPADDVYVYSNLDFFNENQGIFIALTDSGQVAYTTNDGGDTWVQSDNAPFNAIYDMDYGDASTLYATGFTAKIIKSSDGGNTWNTIATPGGEINVGISFKDDSNGFYAGDEGDLHFTSDGGATWTESLFTGWHHFTALAYKGIQVFAAGSDEDIYMSYDNGVNWENVYNGTGDSHLYEIALFQNGYGLICGSQGTMIKFSPIFTSDVTVSTIDGEDNEIEVDETVQLQADVMPENVNQDVIWSIVSGNEFVSIDENGLVTGISAGVATVRAISILDESVYGDFEIIVTEQMGVMENNNSIISVYPNPVNNILNISSKQEISYTEIFNTAGQKVFAGKIINGQVDIHSLTPGAYMLRIVMKNGQSEVFKVIKK